MKTLALPFVLSLLVLCGCANHYVIRLNNGREITTASKPKLKNSSYHFKDARGREIAIPEGRVQEIAPASLSKSEYKPLRPVQSKKPRHWYLLWLA